MCGIKLVVGGFDLRVARDIKRKGKNRTKQDEKAGIDKWSRKC